MRRALVAALCVACRAHVPPTVSLAVASAVAIPTAPRPVASRRMLGMTRIAELPAIDAIAASDSTLYALTTDSGVIVSIALDPPGAAPRIVATGEKEPIAIVVHDGQPVWASSEGLFAGNPRRKLANGAVTALASGRDGLYFAMDHTIWRLAWPRSTTPIAIVRDAIADEIVVAGSSIVWRDRRSVTRFDLASKARVALEAGRKPHDLSSDGRFVLWHEGEADLIAGRDPIAFLYDGAHEWALSHPAGEWWSSERYVMDGDRVYAPGACRTATQKAWCPSDPRDNGPLAVNRRSWFWTEPVCSRGACGATVQIDGLDKEVCNSP